LDLPAGGGSQSPAIAAPSRVAAGAATARRWRHTASWRRRASDAYAWRARSASPQPLETLRRTWWACPLSTVTDTKSTSPKFLPARSWGSGRSTTRSG